MHSVAPAGSWPRNFNGCFAAVNLKDSNSELCSERTDGISMGDGCYQILNLPLTRISYLSAVRSLLPITSCYAEDWYASLKSRRLVIHVERLHWPSDWKDRAPSCLTINMLSVPAHTLMSNSGQSALLAVTLQAWSTTMRPQENSCFRFGHQLPQMMIL